LSGITTHILDLTTGRPASGVHVNLERQSSDGWSTAGSGETNADGRVADFGAPALAAGSYRLTFDTGAYFEAQGVEGFYPEASITFLVRDPSEHFHVPLLLSPNGYSTYRGS